MQAAFEALTGALPFIFLVSLRVGIVFASLPAPFGSVTPVRIRVVLTLFVSLALCAARQDGAPVIELEPVTLGRAALGELLVGAVIGLTVRVTLAAAEVAGNLAGTSMGQGFAASVDPTFGEQALPVGRLLGALMVLIFFAMDGHHVMLAALAWSLDAFPVGDAVGRIGGPGLLEVGAGLLARGLQIASPIVAAMFIVQLGMGLVARSAPRVQVFSLTFAVTSAVGGLVLFASAPAVAAALAETVAELPSLLSDALRGG